MLPEGFLWGVSESGFQFEMGDKFRRDLDTNTDWWYWVRDKTNIEKDLVSGDLPEEGINYYELYSEDHQLAASLGLNAYRLGIEWSRIFPWPTTQVEVDYTLDESYGLVKDVKIKKSTLEELDELANKKALLHYRRIIADLRERGFKVILNLNHFTLPYWLHDPIASRERALSNKRNGWINLRTVVEFAKYAAYMAHSFGDLVDLWATFNEPMVVAELGYLAPYSGFPPGILSPEGARLAILHQLNAHALAYKMVRKFDKEKAYPDSEECASVGIVHSNIGIAQPLDPNDPRDVKAAENDNFFHTGLFFEAIHRGKLNVDFDGESFVNAKWLKGNDWIGLTYYTREVVTYREPPYPSIPLINFKGASGYGFACRPGSTSKDGNPVSSLGWEVYPEGLYDSIKAASEYGVPVYVAENGVADSRDVLRPYYIASHVKVMERAVEDGYDVRGYFYWALTDNYEWALGFRMRFGLYEVNLLTKERKPRPKSVGVYRSIVRNNGVPEEIMKSLGVEEL